MMTQCHRRPGQLAARSRPGPLPAVTVNAEPDTLQAILVVAPTGTRGCEPCPQPRAEALDQTRTWAPAASQLVAFL